LESPAGDGTRTVLRQTLSVKQNFWASTFRSILEADPKSRWGVILDAEKMKKCVWLLPGLVTVVEFLDWTADDQLQHSRFVALRDDKDAWLVVKESPVR